MSKLIRTTSVFPYPNIINNSAAIPLGITDSLIPILWNPQPDKTKTLLILGNNHSGKTNMLRVIARWCLQNYLYYGVDITGDVDQIFGTTKHHRDYLLSDPALSLGSTVGNQIHALTKNLENTIDLISQDKQFARQTPKGYPESFIGAGHTQERVIIIDRVDLLFTPDVPISIQGRILTAITTLAKLSVKHGVRLILTANTSPLQLTLKEKYPFPHDTLQLVHNPKTKTFQGEITGHEGVFTLYLDQYTFTPQQARHDTSIPRQMPNWDRLTIGVAKNGENNIEWKTKTFPHAFIAGRSGLGKTTLLKNIAQQGLHKGWNICVADIKKVDWQDFAKKPHMSVANTLDDIANMIQKIENIMDDRYKTMKEQKINYFTNITSPTPPILLVIDEVYPIVAVDPLDTDEGRRLNKLREECVQNLSSIARLGRAAGIHLAFASQRPDGMPMTMMANIDCRIALGPMEERYSKIMFNDTRAVNISSTIPWQGIMLQGNVYEEFVRNLT